MKLILQITLGVFLGTLAAQFTIDRWHARQDNIAKSAEEILRIRRDKIRKDQAERIRKLLLENRQRNSPNTKELPDDFVPDDANAQ